MNYTERKRKKRKRRFLLFLFVICLALILAYYFDLFNIGLGGLTNGNEKEPSTTIEENLSTDERSDNNTNYIEIKIKDDQITLNNEVVTFDELESKINDLYSDNSTVKLIDNIAYESTYNSVDSLLKEMNLVVVYEEDGQK